MSLQSVHTALTTAIVTAVGSTPLERENVYFEKPTNAQWARLSYLPNTPTVETLGDTGEDMADGIVQVDFYFPANAGDKTADDVTETFRAAFKAGTKLTSSGQVVVITSCGRSAGRIEDNWFVVSVTVGWYALIAR